MTAGTTLGATGVNEYLGASIMDTAPLCITTFLAPAYSSIPRYCYTSCRAAVKRSPRATYRSSRHRRLSTHGQACIWWQLACRAAFLRSARGGFDGRNMQRHVEQMRTGRSMRDCCARYLPSVEARPANGVDIAAATSQPQTRKGVDLTRHVA